MSIKEKWFLIIYLLESTLYFMISNNISYAFSPKRYVKYCFSDSPIRDEYLLTSSQKHPLVCKIYAILEMSDSLGPRAVGT